MSQRLLSLAPCVALFALLGFVSWSAVLVFVEAAAGLQAGF